ncbi:MAG: hypothetical protein QXY15_10880 [Candidatus Nitrosotenuis sp.]
MPTRPSITKMLYDKMTSHQTAGTTRIQHMPISNKLYQVYHKQLPSGLPSYVVKSPSGTEVGEYSSQEMAEQVAQKMESQFGS